MADDRRLAWVLRLCHMVSRNRCMFGACIVMGSYETEICAFAVLRAGPPSIMSYPERCATWKVRSSKYLIQSNWIVHSLSIVPCDLLIAVVRVFFSLGLVGIL